jgi:hypothetical protein
MGTELSTIPAKCDMALAALAKARTLEDVLAIKNTAEALRVYAEKHRAAVEARNQCQEIVLLAEAKIGVALEAARERGELATRERHGRGGQGGLIPGGNKTPATLKDIGLTPKEAMHAKHMAEAGEDAIRRAAKAASDAKRPLRRDDVRPKPTPATPQAVARETLKEEPSMPRVRVAGKPPSDEMIRKIAEDAEWGEKTLDMALWVAEQVRAGKGLPFATEVGKQFGQTGSAATQPVLIIVRTLCAVRAQDAGKPNALAVEAEVERRVQEHIAQLEQTVGAQLSALTVRAEKAEKLLAEARGKFPRRHYRFMLAAVSPDRYDSTERKELAGEVFRHLKEFEPALVMTEEEETVKTERLRAAAEANRRWREHQALRAKQQAEAAARRAARATPR